MGYLPKIILILAVSLLPFAARAQTANVSANGVGNTTAKVEKAAEVLSRAKTLYSEEGPKVAFPEFEKALTLFRNEADRSGEAITLGLIGNCYKKFGDFAKADRKSVV